MLDQKQENRYFKFYNRMIMKYLNKHRKKYDYDTINQFRNDIFIKLYTNKSKLPKKENELDKYIYITCKNYILDYKRANKPYIEYTQDNEFLENALTNNNIDEDYIIPEHYNIKFKKLGELKYSILEYKKNGYSITEISKILKKSRANIYNTFKILKHNENL
jgi:DNA-directed RNA polymerase specialized sigma24 family protein